jgi:hypothetical protein
MFPNVDMPLIGGIIALVGLLASGIVTWLYLRKAKALQEDPLSHRAKYVQPLVALTSTSLITCCGIILMLVFSASPEITTAIAWIITLINWRDLFRLFVNLVYVFLSREFVVA